MASTAEFSGADGFKLYQLRALGERCMKSGNHSEALDALKKLRDLQPRDISVLLLLVKCYYAQRKYTDSFETAKVIRDELLEKNLAARDLIVEADESYIAGSAVDPIVFLWCACCALFSNTSVVNLDVVMECLQKIADVSSNVIYQVGEQLRISAQDHFEGFFSLMLPMVEEIRLRISRITDIDENLKKKALLHCSANEAKCLLNIGRAEDAIELCKECIIEMEQQHGSHAEEFVMYSDFLGSIGLSYLKERKYVESFTHFEKTLVSLRKTRPTTAAGRTRKEKLIDAAQVVLVDLQNVLRHENGSGKICHDGQV